MFSQEQRLREAFAISSETKFIMVTAIIRLCKMALWLMHDGEISLSLTLL